MKASRDVRGGASVIDGGVKQARATILKRCYESVMRLAAIIAVSVVGFVVGVAATSIAYPRLRPVLGHASVRETAIKSIAQQRGHVETVVLGDSIVEFANVDGLCGGSILNAGLAGATVGDVRRLAPDVLAETHPRRVIVAVGVNNTKTATRPESEAFRRDYATLLEEIRSAGAVASVATIAPISGARGFAPGRVPTLNAQIRSLGAPVVVLSPVETRDGVHPTAHGYQTWKADLARGC